MNQQNLRNLLPRSPAYMSGAIPFPATLGTPAFETWSAPDSLSSTPKIELRLYAVEIPEIIRSNNDLWILWNHLTKRPYGMTTSRDAAFICAKYGWHVQSMIIDMALADHLSATPEESPTAKMVRSAYAECCTEMLGWHTLLDEAGQTHHLTNNLRFALHDVTETYRVGERGGKLLEKIIAANNVATNNFRDWQEKIKDRVRINGREISTYTDWGFLKMLYFQTTNPEDWDRFAENVMKLRKQYIPLLEPVYEIAQTGKTETTFLPLLTSLRTHKYMQQLNLNRVPNITADQLRLTLSRLLALYQTLREAEAE